MSIARATRGSDETSPSRLCPRFYATDADRLRRFDQEARTLAALSHPNILAVYDVGHHDGAPYLISELVEGDTLRARLGEAPRPLPARASVDDAAQMRAASPQRMPRGSSIVT